MLTLLLLVILTALVFEFINGFHDTANSIATVVATKVLTPTQAVILAAGHPRPVRNFRTAYRKLAVESPCPNSLTVLVTARGGHSTSSATRRASAVKSAKKSSGSNAARRGVAGVAASITAGSVGAHLAARRACLPSSVRTAFSTLYATHVVNLVRWS